VKPLNKSSVAIVGTVCNCAEYLPRLIKLLRQIFSVADSLIFFLVESDSTDATVSVLRRFSVEIDNFKFTTLGNLKTNMPIRSERLAYCRNCYLHNLRSQKDGIHIDYIVVTDMDSANLHLKPEGVYSCWNYNSWNVMSANSLGRYYDIWALRHPFLCPTDCHAQYRFLRSIGLNKFLSMYISVYSKMIHIPPGFRPISVDSSFGGFAIYTSSHLLKSSYKGLTCDGYEVCEHLSVHQAIKSQNGTIYINPRMTNSWHSEHTKFSSSIGLLLYALICTYSSLKSRILSIYRGVL
jgi:hypothetical protein